MLPPRVQNLEEKSTTKCNQRKMTVLNSRGGLDTAWGNQSDTKAKPFQIYPSASKSIIRQHGESFLPKTHCSVELLGCFISEHHFHMLISPKKTTHQTKLRSPNCGCFSLKQPKRGKTKYRMIIGGNAAWTCTFRLTAMWICLCTTFWKGHKPAPESKQTARDSNEAERLTGYSTHREQPDRQHSVG